MKKLFSILLCLALVFSLGTAAFASSGEAASSTEMTVAEPTVSESAAANPDQAILVDGVAMGQVQRLQTTAAVVYGDSFAFFFSMEKKN